MNNFLKKNLEKIKQLKLSTTKSNQHDYPKFEIFSHELTELPSAEEIKKKPFIYPLIKPYAMVQINFDKKENVMTYNVIEPLLNDKEKQILENLKEGLIQIIDISLHDIRKQSEVIDFLEKNIKRILEEYDIHLTDTQYVKIMYYVFRDFVGLNEIEPVLRDPYIEDIGCDGINIPIYVIHQKYGSMKTNIIYHDIEELKKFVTKLAERCNRYISYAEPLLDGALPDGTRIHASLAEDVTTRGPTFSIRKFKRTPYTPIEMIKLGTVSPEMLAYLWFIVEHGANILITGGVASGKTSFLNCISMFIPPEAKIVSIEDTRELNLPHENWIPGVARAGFTGSGIGEVTMFELLKESFRQNPDYLIVGEIRGKEAYVMFQGMASGHPSLSTVHAGNLDDLIKRLKTKPISLSPGLIDSLDVVIVMVHAREKGKSARRVKEIVEIESVDVETAMPRAVKVFIWHPADDTFEYRANSWLLHKIASEKGLSMNNVIKDIAKRKKIIEYMLEKDITDMKQYETNNRIYIKLLHKPVIL